MTGRRALRCDEIVVTRRFYSIITYMITRLNQELCNNETSSAVRFDIYNFFLEKFNRAVRQCDIIAASFASLFLPWGLVKCGIHSICQWHVGLGCQSPECMVNEACLFVLSSRGLFKRSQDRRWSEDEVQIRGLEYRLAARTYMTDTWFRELSDIGVCHFLVKFPEQAYRVEVYIRTMLLRYNGNLWSRCNDIPQKSAEKSNGPSDANRETRQETQL